MSELKKTDAKEPEQTEPTELVNKESTELAATGRVSGKGGRAAGAEDIDMDQDVKMPRIAILQGLSQMVSDGQGTPGKLANAITKEVFGDEFIFIPLFLFKTRARFDLKTGMICMSRDTLNCTYCNCNEGHGEGFDCLSCPQSKWPDKKQFPDASGPDCSLVYNYPVLNANNIKGFPLSISLMRTSVKAAKDLNSMLMFTGEDFFSSKIKMSVKKTDGEKGTYFSPVFEMVGKATDEEYEYAKSVYTKLRHKTIDVDLTAESPVGKDEEQAPF